MDYSKALIIHQAFSVINHVSSYLTSKSVSCVLTDFDVKYEGVSTRIFCRHELIFRLL